MPGSHPNLHKWEKFDPTKRTDGLVSLRALQDLLGVPSKKIHSWHSRKATNGFPEAVGCTLVPQYSGDKRKSLLWRPEEVLDWFNAYDPNTNRGGTFGNRGNRRGRG